MTNAQTLVGGMTKSGNRLVVPQAGRYLINARYYFSGPSNVLMTGVISVNGTEKQRHSIFKNTGDDYPIGMSIILDLAASDAISLYAQSSSSIYGVDGYQTFVQVLKVI